MSPGAFITFEGVEGAGKSTQIRRAVSYLQENGFRVYVTREPGGSPLAEKIRSLILDEYDDPPVGRAEVLLMQAARAQHVDRVIKPHLGAGDVVVCDRYYHSTIAYQIRARGLDEAFTMRAIEYAIDGVYPDLTIVLDLPVEEGLARQSERNRMEDEGVTFHEAVRGSFLEQARKEPERIRVIDASASEDEVHARVVEVIRPVVESVMAAAERADG